MINLGHFVIGRKHEFCVIDLFEIDASLNLSANFDRVPLAEWRRHWFCHGRRHSANGTHLTVWGCVFGEEAQSGISQMRQPAEGTRLMKSLKIQSRRTFGEPQEFVVKNVALIAASLVIGGYEIKSRGDRKRLLTLQSK